MIIKRIKRKIKYLKQRRILMDAAIRPFAEGKWDYFTLMLDYLRCRRSLRVTPEEYRLYNFPYLKHRYRKQFILIHNYQQYANINTSGFAVLKYVFYLYVPDLFNREMILAPVCGEEEFVAFLKRNQKIVTKPHAGSRGRNIEIHNYIDDATAKKLFATFTPEEPIVCEGFIRQHPEMEKLKPGSVNSIRIVSLLVNDEVEILSATLKIGLEEESITDNMSQGGIGAQVDIATGIISTFGKDFKLNSYAYHPVSGVKIIGFQIPHWDEAINLIKTAHKRVPQCALYGWDIAITEDGVDIVEANCHPGSRIMQAMDGIPKGKTLLPMMKKDHMKGIREENWKEMDRIYREHCVMK